MSFFKADVVDRPAAQRVDAITGNNEAVFSVKRNRARIVGVDVKLESVR